MLGPGHPGEAADLKVIGHESRRRAVPVGARQDLRDGSFPGIGQGTGEDDIAVEDRPGDEVKLLLGIGGVLRVGRRHGQAAAMLHVDAPGFCAEHSSVGPYPLPLLRIIIDAEELDGIGRVQFALIGRRDASPVRVQGGSGRCHGQGRAVDHAVGFAIELRCAIVDLAGVAHFCFTRGEAEGVGARADPGGAFRLVLLLVDAVPVEPVGSR